MILKIDKLGRVLIPKPIREFLNLKEDNKLKLEVIEDKIVISKIEEGE